MTANHPVTFKTWRISLEEFHPNHHTVLDGLGIPRKINIDYETYGASIKFVTFETTCEKQESMLKLLYTTKLILLQVEVGNPFAPYHQFV